jgi:TolB protein
LLVISADRNLTVIDTGSGSESVFDCPLEGMTDGSVGADGSFIFSLSIADSIDAHDIWRYFPANGKVRQLTRMAKMQHDPAWCGDHRIVFVSSTSEQDHDLWLIDLINGSQHQLTAGQLFHFEPSCWGDTIVFSANRSGDYELWTTDLQGRKFERLTNEPGLDAQPSWSPGGDQIVWVSNRSGYPALWLMEKDGSDRRQLSPAGLICRNPAWSD